MFNVKWYVHVPGNREFHGRLSRFKWRTERDTRKVNAWLTKLGHAPQATTERIWWEV